MRGLSFVNILPLIFIVFSFNQAFSFSWFPKITFKKPDSSMQVLNPESFQSWQELKSLVATTSVGQKIDSELILRESGDGLPHTDAKLRLFGTTGEPRVLYYRDTAAWCPYCQKVWILLEEKKIPYRVEKINMRSYGDKPQEYLRKVPSGLLPAIELDGKLLTDSLAIMLTLDEVFSGPNYKPMLPDTKEEIDRANILLKLERALFASWCTLVFRPNIGSGPRSRFEMDLDTVDRELQVTSSPWFLNEFSIVDLTYITHIERMCASVPYWSGFKIRGDGRWPTIERWLDAFEAMPSYMATKSDYYTHIKDIPPQYGPGYDAPGCEALKAVIDGTDGSWSLPLPPFSPSDVEPISAAIDPGTIDAKHEAAFKLTMNYENVIKFALRGAGEVGAKRFQAPLADPYAVPNLSYYDDMDTCLRYITTCLLHGSNDPSDYPRLVSLTGSTGSNIITDEKIKEDMIKSLAYLRDRIGVPRDMSYPAARQLRAHITFTMTQL